MKTFLDHFGDSLDQIETAVVDLFEGKVVDASVTTALSRCDDLLEGL
jgi:hypothetical protein